MLRIANPALGRTFAEIGRCVHRAPYIWVQKLRKGIHRPAVDLVVHDSRRILALGTTMCSAINA